MAPGAISGVLRRSSRDGQVLCPTAGAVRVCAFIRRHKQLSITVAVALLIAGPLLTCTGGEAFLLNPVSSTGQALAGLGIIALVVRRVVAAWHRKQVAQGHCRWHRHNPPARQQTQQRGGTP